MLEVDFVVEVDRIDDFTLLVLSELADWLLEDERVDLRLLEGVLVDFWLENDDELVVCRLLDNVLADLSTLMDVLVNF